MGNKIEFTEDMINFGAGRKTTPNESIALFSSLKENPRQTFAYAILPNGKKIKGLRYPQLYHGTNYYLGIDDALAEMEEFGGLVRGRNRQVSLGADLRLKNHVLETCDGGLGGTAFRGTTEFPRGIGDGVAAIDFAEDEGGLVFEIVDTYGWDVRNLSDFKNPEIPEFLPRENEISIPRFVPKEKIKRIGVVQQNRYGTYYIDWRVNPFFEDSSPPK